MIADVNPSQARILSILLFAVVLWATEAINPTVVSIAVIVLIALFGVLPYREVAAQLGSPILWRLIGIFIFAEAVKQSGLAERIVYKIVKLANGKVRTFFILYVSVTFMFVFFIPIITGRVVIILTMLLGLFSVLKITAPSNIGKAIFISLPLLSLTSSTSVIVGSSSIIYAVGLIEELSNLKFSYLSWLLMNFPIGLIITISIYYIFMRLYPPEIEEFSGGNEYLNKIEGLSGFLRTEEKKVLFVYGFLLFLWFADLSADYPTELMAALILLLPKVGVLTWKEASKGIDWGMLILFSSAFAIAKALQETNVISDCVRFMLHYVINLSPLTLLAILFLFTMVVRLGMNNMTPAVAVLIPLVFDLGRTIGINPVCLSLVIVYASTAVFLPTQTSPGVITYSYGYYSAKDMLKSAVFINLLMFILVIMAAKFYWPLFGIPIYLN